MKTKTPELVLDPYYIEYAMDNCFYRVTGKERAYKYSAHRAKALADAGFLALSDKHPRRRPHDIEGSIWYWPTEEGLAWWISKRAEDGERWLRRDSANHLERYGVEYMKDGAPNVGYLLRYFDGKGIGGQIELYVGRLDGMLVWIALRDGIVKFVSHRDYSGAPHNCEEYVTVALTAEGMSYFDRLPRLLLECA